MNILIAEDEKDIRELVKIHLIKDGYNVFEAANGIEAIEVFKNNKIDMIILDVMMPLLDGFAVVKNVRETSMIPVMFLTARAEDTDKILGLGLGADDYMTKPFSPIELTARVQAQLRRYNKYSKTSYVSDVAIGELILNKENCTVHKNKIKLELNAKEYKILEFLMENAGKVYTKKQLYEAVWGEPYFGDDNTIMVHISYLRDKIEDNPKSPKYLKTIRGIGYRFEKVNKL
ncbi:response regulator transcription factor [Clostridium sp. YIM B02515]|uniref:Stage 0 sporulation protein A homolog n=1 Tax=Clostridium rhizosphaerae TaxID=2803861 RepID=A0ABS1TH57_9CLOT|nr:response regulator transcription factor [Clostridium rhizosphaerae]